MATIITSPQHPSSTLVNISSDADLRLIRILAPHTTSKTFESNCSTAITNGDAAGLIRTILSEPQAIGQLLSADYTTEEAMGTFSLFGALLERVEQREVQCELCGGLADAVAATNGSDASAEKRSAMLAALFNLRSDGVEKVRLLTKIVDLAEAASLAPGEGVSSLSDLLEPSMLESSLAGWGDIPEGEKRCLFRAVVKGMDRLLDKLRSERGDDVAEASLEVQVDKNIKDVADRKQTYLLLILDTYKYEVRALIRSWC
jgi:hypothetical protein